MSEKEDVLLTALDEAVEAREGTYFRLDYPTERDHAIKQYAEAREAIRRALTPAPRVVVTEAMVEAMSRHVYQYALTTHADIRAGLTAALTEAPADGA